MAAGSDRSEQDAEEARNTAAIEELRRAVRALSQTAADAFGSVPWFPSLPAQTRSWARLVVGRELMMMAADIATPQPPRLRSIFSGAPLEVTGQISLDQILELIRLTVDVVLNGLDDVMDDTSASLVRGALERYGREVAFAAAAVYAKVAENRGRAGAQRQMLLLDALVDGGEEQIAERASGLFPLGVPVQVIGLLPRPDAGVHVLHEVTRTAERHRVTVCAAQRGRYVLAILPDAAAGALADLASPSRWNTEVAGSSGPLITHHTIVTSGMVGSLSAAGPATAAVLSSLRAVPAWQGSPGLLHVDDLLPERTLCGDQQAADQLVAECHGPLASAGRGLVETVDALLAHDGSPDAAARSIPVHVNTLRYRLDRVIALTGKDPRRGRDAFALRMAFTLARTGGHAFQ
ncbi:PucR family transcriptional regulator [Parafrankia elaeagni]|uniref:PucR family transcriptional regulator n=1 Tax=Parafrankia elaeagni TaxID=222534 RepID=UPI00037065D2|nr:helix-turn-helix domain-containing protein [Parafrankia elaeagni]